MDRASLARSGPWPFRVAWVVLPLLAGPALAEALDGTQRPVQVVASTGLWGAWVAALVAALLPTTVSLTVVRILTPAGVAAVAAAVADALRDGGQADGRHVVALAAALLAATAAFGPTTGATFVNGSSYGDEVRQPLRVPTALLLGPVELAWVAVAVGSATGPLLLAAGQWVAGGAAVAAGLPAAYWGVRVLHTLARRWTVLVPGGLVLHDPLTLADPVLFRRATITALGPAPADTTAVDLTAGAAGLAVEARLSRPVTLVTTEDRRRGVTETKEVEAVLFTPTRPGAFLAAARSRSLGGKTAPPAGFRAGGDG